MPADITGTYVVLETHGQRKFDFQRGPIFTQVLLADEINRAPPKTQAGCSKDWKNGSLPWRIRITICRGRSSSSPRRDRTPPMERFHCPRRNWTAFWSS